MFNKKNFFSNFSTCLKKTNQAFQLLKKDIENSAIPVLDSYSKKYQTENNNYYIDNHISNISLTYFAYYLQYQHNLL